MELKFVLAQRAAEATASKRDMANGPTQSYLYLLPYDPPSQ